MKHIKPFGMERTCNNYVMWLLDRNVQDAHVVINLFWKHGPPMFNRYRYGEMSEREGVPEMLNQHDQKNLYFVVNAKNPYAWIVSFVRGIRKGLIHDGNYRKPDADVLDNWIRPDEEYLDNLDNPEYLKAYCRKYNIRYRQWSSLPEDRMHLIRYEDLLTSEKREISRLCDKWGMHREVDFEVAENWMSTEQDQRDVNFDPSYYTEHRYMDDLTDNQMQAVQEEIDWNFVSSFLGYKRR